MSWGKAALLALGVSAAAVTVLVLGLLWDTRGDSGADAPPYAAMIVVILSLLVISLVPLYVLLAILTANIRGRWPVALLYGFVSMLPIAALNFTVAANVRDFLQPVSLFPIAVIAALGTAGRLLVRP